MLGSESKNLRRRRPKKRNLTLLRRKRAPEKSLKVKNLAVSASMVIRASTQTMMLTTPQMTPWHPKIKETTKSN